MSLSFGQQQRLLFAGSTAALAVGLYVAVSDPVAGLFISALTVLSTLVLGGVESGKGTSGRQTALLNDMQEKQAGRWGGLTVLLLLVFVFNEVYLLAALILLAWAWQKYTSPRLTDEEANAAALARIVVAIVVSLGYFMPTVALIPVVAVAGMFVLAVAPPDSAVQNIQKRVNKVIN